MADFDGEAFVNRFMAVWGDHDILSWRLFTDDHAAGMSAAGGRRHKPEKRRFSF
jgi:hypothetical protein